MKPEKIISRAVKENPELKKAISYIIDEAMLAAYTLGKREAAAAAENTLKSWVTK